MSSSGSVKLRYEKCLVNWGNASDIQRKGWTGLTQTSVIEQALGVLEDHSYVAAVDQQNPSGGPQTVRYFINPKVRKDMP